MASLVQYDPNQLTNTLDKKDLPKPFEQDIFLFQTYLPTVNLYPDVLNHLDDKKEEELRLYEDPDHIFGKHSVILKTSKDELLGCLPFHECEIPHRLLLAGKYLYAKIYDCVELDFEDDHDYYHRIFVKIYMRD